jgi:hypothetical protein
MCLLKALRSEHRSLRPARWGLKRSRRGKLFFHNSLHLLNVAAAAAAAAFPNPTDRGGVAQTRKSGRKGEGGILHGNDLATGSGQDVGGRCSELAGSW